MDTTQVSSHDKVRTSPKSLGVALAAASFGSWVFFSATCLLVVGLMSTDDEWQGFWHDIVLNPYTVGSYVMLSAVVWAPGVWALRRWRRHAMRDGLAAQ